ncbi:hypothetical protein CAPTEDRAFT_169051 [Capitella teleta]|uniref:Uncharacterized protein n=1 Tax=Capitella teleta TaxID=283909 RepID=R7T7Y3_CAPTE|nr:hypothetical protein CAPTEDRAFT_169051 [Capitella teleta]|eukprot:ELT89744.1 hypothetical protein CAPTEDRAFT_169051 [Capitella teleta]
MKNNEVVRCMFSEWFPTFKTLTISSRVISLPDDVREYLLADGFVLPKECEADSSVDVRDGWTDDDEEDAERPHFPVFHESLLSAISALGGTVFPKLTWSAPQDATWVSFNNSMECKSPSDIYLLLKSSTFVSHDLTEAFRYCDDGPVPVSHSLVLRKWTDVDPSSEFRCFVFDQTLIAISQRHTKAYFSHLAPLNHQIIADIGNFYRSEICDKFPLQQYIFDVIWKNNGVVTLVDFNPFGRTTDALLFSWDSDLAQGQISQLLSAALDKGEPTLRCLESEADASVDPFQCYRVPQDFVHLASGEDPEKLLDLLNLKIQQQNEEDEDSG